MRVKMLDFHNEKVYNINVRKVKGKNYDFRRN